MEGHENPPTHDSSEGGICGGWNHPFVTQNASGRVVVAMKTLHHWKREWEGAVVGGIPLFHSKHEWKGTKTLHLMIRAKEVSVEGGIPLRHSKREWKGCRCHENPLIHDSSEGGFCGGWNTPSSLET